MSNTDSTIEYTFDYLAFSDIIKTEERRVREKVEHVVLNNTWSKAFLDVKYLKKMLKRAQRDGIDVVLSLFEIRKFGLERYTPMAKNAENYSEDC